jgi:hypothetical protein
MQFSIVAFVSLIAVALASPIAMPVPDTGKLYQSQVSICGNLLEIR